MPRIDNCQQCGEQVQRSHSSAAKITCRSCRAIKPCGTRSGYSAGCRCQPCKDAQAAAMREYAARRKAEGRPIPRSEWRAYEDIVCDCCGTTFTREKRNDPRYPKSYCSTLCRDYAQWGPRSKPIPKTHMIFMIGKTCKVPPRKTTGPYRIQCGWCHQAHTSPHDTTAYCSTECKGRARRARRRGRVHGAHGTYTWGQVTHLWEMFERSCAYCRQATPLEDIQAEHVNALARGGANNIGNILPSCGPCNSDKRDLTMSEWEQDRARRELPTVVTRWERDDPRYKHLSPATLTAVA